jgi:hypothetical protein
VTKPTDEAREKIALWMISQNFATGHGDTITSLLHELRWQIDERRHNAILISDALKGMLRLFDGEGNMVADFPTMSLAIQKGYEALSATMRGPACSQKESG